jgi:thiamine kinase-like enzyme
MAYDFFPGKTLYEFNNPVAFGELLNWLETNVWKDCDANLHEASIEFYKTKSLGRINKFLEKYPNIKNVTNIDGVNVKDYIYYLNNIDWEYLATVTRPGFLHGDLQFDNIVISDSGEFKIIDWRHEFAGIVDYGDIYYDLAKMAGGLIINYANIKNHNFNIEIDNDSVTLSIPNIDHITVYQERLKKYILNNKLDYKKVQQLIPIIFWNMSPLHTAPFDIFLWYLGIKLFAELDNE